MNVLSLLLLLFLLLLLLMMVVVVVVMLTITSRHHLVRGHKTRHALAYRRIVLCGFIQVQIFKKQNQKAITCCVLLLIVDTYDSTLTSTYMIPRTLDDIVRS